MSVLFIDSNPSVTVTEFLQKLGVDKVGPAQVAFPKAESDSVVVCHDCLTPVAILPGAFKGLIGILSSTLKIFKLRMQ